MPSVFGKVKPHQARAVPFESKNRQFEVPSMQQLADHLLLPMMPYPGQEAAITTTSGAHALMFAIFENAIHDLRSGQYAQCVSADRKARAAWDWICSAEHRWLYSYEHICDVLHFDADYLRKGLRQWMPDQTRPPLVHLPRVSQSSCRTKERRQHVAH